MTITIPRNPAATIPPVADAPDVRPLSKSDALLTAAWFGLMTGAAEISARLAALLAVDHTVRFDRNAIWTVPLSYMCVFVFLGLLLLGLARVLPRLRYARWPVTVFAFLGLWTGFLLYPRLHPLAVAVLAAGLAAQVGRLAASHTSTLRKVVRWTTPALLACVAAAAMLLIAGQRLSERNAHAALPPVARTGTPNILLLILDTVRAANLSVYGYIRPTTPQLEWLAGRGVRFDTAVATAPWTLTSHVSMLTGLYPFETTADWESGLGAGPPTLAEVLGAAGYASGAFVANRLYTTPEWGLDRGFVTYRGYAVSPGQAVANGMLTRAAAGWYNRIAGTYHLPGRKNAAHLNRELLGWVDRRDTARPFFAMVNYYDAHEPYVEGLPGRRFAQIEPPTRTIATGRSYSPAEVRGLIDAYDDAIAYLDDQLGHLFRELDRRGLLDNTLIIVTSDHGEEFGENGYFSHGNGLYLPSLHVPLIFSYPAGLAHGQRVVAPVTLRDLPATIARAAGVSDHPFSGHPLVIVDADSAAPASPAASPLLSEVNFVRNQPEWYPVAAGDMKSLLEGGHHYIRNGDGSEELFRLGAAIRRLDPASDPAARAELQQLRARLGAVLNEVEKQ